MATHPDPEAFEGTVAAIVAERRPDHERRLQSAARITALRVMKEMSQVAVAREIGVSQTTLCRIENGTSAPTTTAARQLAELYGVDVAFLLADT